LVFQASADPATAWSKTIDRKLPVGSSPLNTACFGNFLGENRLTAVVVRDREILAFPVVGDGTAAGFARLTGQALERTKGFDSGLTNPAITPIDVNKDHRPDLLVTCDGGAMLLVNRGFGVFFPDTDAGALLNAAGKIPGISLSSNRARSAITVPGESDSLLVVTDTGNLIGVK
jgi:hypothetical protein